jgi:hypothetical protein
MRIRKDAKKRIAETKKNSFWNFSFRKSMERRNYNNNVDNKKNSSFFSNPSSPMLNATQTEMNDYSTPQPIVSVTFQW